MCNQELEINSLSNLVTSLSCSLHEVREELSDLKKCCAISGTGCFISYVIVVSGSISDSPEPKRTNEGEKTQLPAINEPDSKFNVDLFGITECSTNTPIDRKGFMQTLTICYTTSPWEICVWEKTSSYILKIIHIVDTEICYITSNRKLTSPVRVYSYCGYCNLLYNLKQKANFSSESVFILWILQFVI